MIIPVFFGIGTILLGRVNKRNKNSYLHEFKILTVHLMDISWIYTLYENITWLILPFAKIENLKTTKTSILIYSKISNNPSLENTLNLVSKEVFIGQKRFPEIKIRRVSNCSQGSPIICCFQPDSFLRINCIHLP